MANNTMGNARAPRRQLADQLDRLDVILDGLADALNESVADAVRDVVGQVVKEAVESTIKEVLGSPDLLRAALAAHGLPAAEPTPTPTHRPEPSQAQRRPSLKERVTRATLRACDKVRQAASQAGKALGNAWSWSLNTLRAGRGRLKAVGTVCASAVKLAWQYPVPCAAAAAAGVAAGVGAYLAVPVLASLACGLGGSALAAAGIILRPVWQLLRGPAGA